jgi:hypothetical protein
MKLLRSREAFRFSESKPKDKRTVSVVLDGLIEDYKINDKSVEWAEATVDR